MQRFFVWLSVIGVGVITLWGCRNEPQTLILATTTSTHDSGLLAAILPDFEQQFEATVNVVAVGTGQAIALGEAGDADVILVHARSREDAFVAEGYGVERFDVMYNDFVVIGPTDDPAGVAGMREVTAVLAAIAATESLFVSRGDDSGTHIREQSLWEAAGIEPSGAWYQSVGQGMGATLTVADEQQAYTLSDRATYVARQSEGLSLVILSEGDMRLVNPYGVIAVNPDLHADIEAELATQFVEWLVSPPTQAAIAAYERNGEQLFFANGAGNCPPQCNSTP